MMPETNEMSREAKITATLAHRGWPASTMQTLNESEKDELARIYDEHVLPMTGLAGAFDALWARHRERLDNAKAAAEAHGSPPEEGTDVDE